MMNKSSCGSSSSNSNNRRIISSSWASSSSSSNFRNSSKRYCQTWLLRCYYFFIFNLILNILFFSDHWTVRFHWMIRSLDSPVHSMTLISVKCPHLIVCCPNILSIVSSSFSAKNIQGMLRI